MMLNLSTRGIVLCTGMMFIMLLFAILYEFDNSKALVSWIRGIQQCQPLKLKTSGSNIDQMISISFDGNQFFIFLDESPLVRAYLDVVRDTVCGLTLRTRDGSIDPGVQVYTNALNVDRRVKGEDWPLIGITMVGQKRLINIEWALIFVIANKVPGDFIECGVWRGGSSILARAVLKALNINDRHVWLTDSFQGLPMARTANDNNEWSKQKYLKVLI
jgi:hypothetical protein